MTILVFFLQAIGGTLLACGIVKLWILLMLWFDPSQRAEVNVTLKAGALWVDCLCIAGGMALAALASRLL